MTITATVLNGAIQLPPGTQLPEGAKLQITLPEPKPAGTHLPTLYDTLRGLVGAAQELPADMADEHDHYIHGAPRRTQT
jgi:hypothetical protein